MQEQTESTLITYRLASIEDQLGGLKSDMGDIHGKTNQLIDALIGNKLTNSKGLAQKIEDMEKKIAEHEEILKRIRWFWLGVLSVGSALALVINLVIKLFF
jgi:peptidoglycan hydrolase CwlO-like protein